MALQEPKKYVYGELNKEISKNSYSGKTTDSLEIIVDNNEGTISGNVLWDNILGEGNDSIYSGHQGKILESRVDALSKQLQTEVDKFNATAHQLVNDIGVEEHQRTIVDEQLVDKIAGVVAQLSQLNSSLTSRISSEERRASTEEQKIRGELKGNETLIANVEDALKELLEEEAKRALSEEESIRNEISASNTKLSKDISATKEFVKREVSKLEIVDNDLSKRISDEELARKVLDASINNRLDFIEEEISNQENPEDVISEKISEVVTLMKDEDKKLSEEIRALDKSLAGSLAKETARATSAEASLQNTIVKNDFDTKAKLTSIEGELQTERVSREESTQNLSTRLDEVETKLKEQPDVNELVDNRIESAVSTLTSEDDRIEKELGVAVASLTELIEKEVARAVSSETSLSYEDLLIKNYIEDGLTSLSSKIEDERADRIVTDTSISNRVSIVEDKLNSQPDVHRVVEDSIKTAIAPLVTEDERLDSEIKATATSITNLIMGEISRATDAEKALSSSDDSIRELIHNECSKLSNAIASLSSDTSVSINNLLSSIESEAKNRQDTDAELLGLIEDEVERATTSEAQINKKIEDSISELSDDFSKKIVEISKTVSGGNEELATIKGRVDDIESEYESFSHNIYEKTIPTLQEQISALYDTNTLTVQLIREEEQRATGEEERLSGAISVLGARIDTAIASECDRATKKESEIEQQLIDLSDDILELDAKFTKEDERLSNKIADEAEHIHYDIDALRLADTLITQSVDDLSQTVITHKELSEASIRELSVSVEGLSTQLNDTTTRLSEEDRELSNRISLLDDKVDEEISNRLTRDTELTNSIEAEIRRALMTELDLSDRIEVNSFDIGVLKDAVQKLEQTDKLLDEKITVEIQDRKTAISKLEQSLKEESDRAKGEEKSIRELVMREVTRLDGVDFDIKYQLEESVSELKSADAELTIALEYEEASRIEADIKLEDAIEDEVIRALDSEAELQYSIDANSNRIDNLTDDISNLEDEVADISASLDDEIFNREREDSLIKSAVNSEVERLRAADSQISSSLSELSNSTTEKFNLVDATITGVNNALIAEALNRELSDNEISRLLSEEIDRSVGADDALSNSLNELRTTTSTELKGLSERIEAESFARGEFATTISNELQNEVQRATTAEGNLQTSINNISETVDGNFASLSTLIHDESANRISLGEELSTRISVEETRAVEADATLAKDINDVRAVLEQKAFSTDIPTKVSQLENDSGYLNTHQDISGKSDVGHTHSMSDITDYEIPEMTQYAKVEDVPTKVSQLDNDVGYLTEHQDLSSYATTESVSTLVADTVEQMNEEINKLKSEMEQTDEMLANEVALLKSITLFIGGTAPIETTEE